MELPSFKALKRLEPDLHERRDIHSSLVGFVYGLPVVGVGETDADGLVEEEEVRAGVPAVGVVCWAVGGVDVARA